MKARMLRRQRELPKTRTDYPAGTFIKTEKGYFYIFDSNRRHRALSKRVVDSWNPPRVVETSEAAVAHYRISSKLRFRNGSLIHSIADGKIYLIVNGKRCHMVSPEAFERLGVSPNRRDVMSVSLDEVNMHELGEDIK